MPSGTGGNTRRTRLDLPTPRTIEDMAEFTRTLRAWGDRLAFGKVGFKVMGSADEYALLPEGDDVTMVFANVVEDSSKFTTLAQSTVGSYYQIPFGEGGTYTITWALDAAIAEEVLATAPVTPPIFAYDFDAVPLHASTVGGAVGVTVPNTGSAPGCDMLTATTYANSSKAEYISTSPTWAQMGGTMLAAPWTFGFLLGDLWTTDPSGSYDIQIGFDVTPYTIWQWRYLPAIIDASTSEETNVQLASPTTNGQVADVDTGSHLAIATNRNTVHLFSWDPVAHTGYHTVMSGPSTYVRTIAFSTFDHQTWATVDTADPEPYVYLWAYLNHDATAPNWTDVLRRTAVWRVNPTDDAGRRALYETLTQSHFAALFTDAPEFDVMTAGTITGSTVGFTPSDGQVGTGDNASSFIHNVVGWCKFTPLVDGTVLLDTVGSAYADTVIGVFSGEVVDQEDLTQVAYNDDPDVGLFAAVSFAVTAGVTYYVAVSPIDDYVETTLALTWSFTADDPLYEYGDDYITTTPLPTDSIQVDLHVSRRAYQHYAPYAYDEIISSDRGYLPLHGATHEQLNEGDRLYLTYTAHDETGDFIAFRGSRTHLSAYRAGY